MQSLPGIPGPPAPRRRRPQPSRRTRAPAQLSKHPKLLFFFFFLLHAPCTVTGSTPRPTKPLLCPPLICPPSRLVLRRQDCPPLHSAGQADWGGGAGPHRCAHGQRGPHRCVPAALRRLLSLLACVAPAGPACTPAAASSTPCISRRAGRALTRAPARLPAHQQSGPSRCRSPRAVR